MLLRKFAVGLALAASFWSGAVAAATSTTDYQLLLQSRADSAAPNEVYLASYSSLDNLIAGAIGSPSTYTQVGISSAFQINGLTWDGSGYRMLLQSRADSAAPNEVYLASYSNLDNLIAGAIGTPSTYTQIGISAAFKIAGLTWDGTAYRMLLQSRVDSAAPNEVYLASYATLDDLIAGGIGAPSTYTQIGISGAFEITDFTYDGGGYRMLLQSRADSAAPNEVYLASYANLDNLIDGAIGSPSTYTQIGISGAFKIAGFSSVTTTIGDPPPPGVPEPMAWSLMIIGFGATGVVMRRRREQLA
jgi:hypothetical protein